MSPSRHLLAGSLSGGLIFGVGMVFAGGCARLALAHGRGHIKQWVATSFSPGRLYTSAC